MLSRLLQQLGQTRLFRKRTESRKNRSGVGCLVNNKKEKIRITETESRWF